MLSAASPLLNEIQSFFQKYQREKLYKVASNQIFLETSVLLCLNSHGSTHECISRQCIEEDS